MAGNAKQWLSNALGEMKKSTLAASFGFALVLFILEKIAEIEFPCPCNPNWNHSFASAFFFVPALIVFMLMCVIKGCKCEEPWADFWYITVPAITWLIIVFLDGRYYACLRTSWSGKYEIINGSTRQYWCKPANLSGEFLSQTQRWYSESQFIGFMVALGLTALYSLYWCYYWKCSTNKTEDERAVVMEMAHRPDEVEQIKTTENQVA